MISESSFAAVFGAAAVGGEDPLVNLARYAIRAGFAIVPCLPGTKQPMCTLPSRDVRRADEQAQEEARLAGRRRWNTAKHPCGVKHALTEERRSDSVIRRLVRDYGRINLGVALGESRVIVVDVDTDAERDAFAASWLAATGEPLPFGMTVASPGVMAADGAWKHKNGGHYWFALPPGLELPSDEGAMKHPSGWIAMWAGRQVLVPPSVRDEGPYLLTGDIHPAPQWLLSQIVDYITERRGRAAAQESRRASGGSGFTGEANIDAWSVAITWDELLEPDGWYDTGIVDNCGCSIWTAPGVHASYKSATAHDVGCTQYDDAPGHCPLHIWTDNPPEFLINTPFGDKTFTKIQYVALRDHDGAIPLACRAEGIAREAVPLIALPGVATGLGGPLAASFGVPPSIVGPPDPEQPLFVEPDGTPRYASGEALATASGAPMAHGLTSNGAPSQDHGAPATHPTAAQYEDSSGIRWTPPPGATSEEIAAHGLRPVTPEYETWAEQHENQLSDAELQAAGFEPAPGPPRLMGLPPVGAPPGSGPPLPPPLVPPVPPGPGVVDPYGPFENLVRGKFQDLVIKAEAERRWTEHRYPYAARVAARGFEPMSLLLKSAAETPPEFLVDRILRAGSYGVLGAQYKAGKTFLMIDLMLSIAAGAPWLGLIPVKQGRVAGMHNEGDKVEFSERVRSVARAKGIELTEEVLSRMSVQEGASKLDQPEAVNRLYEDLSSFDPDLVYIDPWYMSAGEGADGKNLAQMGTVLSNLQGIAQELSAALLITAHWNKSGEGKGVERWSGSGLAEWGRVLINVGIDKWTPAAPYREDPTGRTTMDLRVDVSGQTSGSYWVHREVWRDDARRLDTPMRYLVTAREQEDPDSENSAILRDSTVSKRERLLVVFLAVPEGISKSKAIQTAKGGSKRAGGSTLAAWKVAFDELVHAQLIADVGELTVTGEHGQLLSVPGVKYAITESGRLEAQQNEASRKRGDGAVSTARFTGFRPDGTATSENTPEQDT